MAQFQRINYSDLNARQKELYNFQKISGLLADFGFSTYRLTDDWGGADFLAVPFDGSQVLRVQLKGRLYFDKKYQGKDLWVCFRQDDIVYLYPHDELLNTLLESNRIGHTNSWSEKGVYHFPYIPENLADYLREFCLGRE